MHGNKEWQGLFLQRLGKPFLLLVIGTWRDGRDREGRTYLQQKLQAATESVQLSTGVCHRLLPSPIALKDGRDSSCGDALGEGKQPAQQGRRSGFGPLCATCLPRQLSDAGHPMRLTSWHLLTSGLLASHVHPKRLRHQVMPGNLSWRLSSSASPLPPPAINTTHLAHELSPPPVCLSILQESVGFPAGLDGKAPHLCPFSPPDRDRRVDSPALSARGSDLPGARQDDKKELMIYYALVIVLDVKLCDGAIYLQGLGGLVTRMLRLQGFFKNS